MRITPHLLIWLLITVGVVVAIALLKLASWQYAAAFGAAVGTTAPSYVQADVPFVVRDSYATLLCISSHSGRPLLPFVVPASQYGEGTAASADGDVHAGVPFVVRDSSGSQLCVSARGGQSVPPFIEP
jgi:hypothetical protein